MKRMTLSEYLAVPEDYRGVWTTELPGSMDYRTVGHSRLGKLEKKPHGKTYPDGI